MTVPTTARRAGPFNGNGVATTFPFTFKVFTDEDVQVIKTSVANVDTVLVLDTDYTITLNADQDATPGGTINYPISGTPLATGEKLSAIGATEYDQQLDLSGGGKFDPVVIENALDRQEFQIQQLAEASDRTLQLSVAAPVGTDTALPAPEANQIIAWNATADGLQNLDPTTLATIVAYGTAVPDVFTGDGTTTAFTLTSNPGALGNLDVSIGGVTQLPTVDYTWTSGTEFTTTSPVPNGVKMLVRYIQALPQGTTDSAASTFVQAGAGAVVRDVQGRLRETVSVCDFMSDAQIADVIAGLGTLDVTAAVQVAENVATAAGAVLVFPAGALLITDTINRGTGSQWLGQHRNKGLPAFINGTKIKFQPTSAKSLWVPSGTPSLYRVGYSTVGFHVEGNSASAAGNSVYAFDVHGINKSTFADLTLTGFRYGFRCYATIDNAFDRVAVNNTYIASVLYDGGVSTTDVWDKCYFANSPIWVQTNGSNLGIRFNSPTVESITTYGMNIVRESAGFEVTTPYLEDVPSANVATNAAFRVGYDGASLSGAKQLTVRGGIIGGRNAGGVGSAFDVDFTDGVEFSGMQVSRFTNAVKTTANTQTYQVVLGGFIATSVSTIVTDDTKVVGEFPLGVFNSGTRNRQTLRTVGDQYTAASAACTGAITTSANWTLTLIGGTVTLKVPNVTGTATASPSFTFGTAIPAKYRPSASLAWPCCVRDNGSNSASPGMVQVDYLTGSISVFKDCSGTTNFTNAANAGLGNGCGVAVSWTI